MYQNELSYLASLKGKDKDAHLELLSFLENNSKQMMFPSLLGTVKENEDFIDTVERQSVRIFQESTSTDRGGLTTINGFVQKQINWLVEKQINVIRGALPKLFGFRAMIRLSAIFAIISASVAVFLAISLLNSSTMFIAFLGLSGSLLGFGLAYGALMVSNKVFSPFRKQVSDSLNFSPLEETIPFTPVLALESKTDKNEPSPNQMLNLFQELLSEPAIDYSTSPNFFNVIQPQDLTLDGRKVGSFEVPSISDTRDDFSDRLDNVHNQDELYALIQVMKSNSSDLANYLLQHTAVIFENKEELSLAELKIPSATVAPR